MEHSIGYVAVIQAVRGKMSMSSSPPLHLPRIPIIDVGTGGGIPGIPIGWALRDTDVTLLDSSARKVSLLNYVLSTLPLDRHISVAHARAEIYAQDETHRRAFRFVVARSLARPATAAELCAPLLAVGGKLIISLDPGLGSTAQLWPDSGLARLGLQKTAEVTVGKYRYLLLTQTAACPDKYPRRPGMPSKRPLF
ncbi:MAG: RsmG family class I SAM-dependent methyltransferase [Acidimicrobiales bacterium]